MKWDQIKFSLCMLIVAISIWVMGPSALAEEHEHSHGSESVVSAEIAPGFISISAVSALTMIIAAGALIIQLRASSSRISKMTAMMVSMAIAMFTGLIGGTLLGIWLQSLFYATVLGITIGVAAGVLAGLSHSWLAVLDGMLSGVMSGMMGAMLGVMITQEHPLIMLVFMDVIMLVVVGSVYQALASEHRTERQNQQLHIAESSKAEFTP
ncbi:hypothetical protein ACHHV8_23605 [Paenibacillus sp. TAB 01]|uniref:hypothetical protein n=1 Tax=Paenibacillus sp. TAB 01 TaxID=3368988 RepID=UPI003751E572